MISIIVPVYNVINYLDGCVQSILLQSYKNFELILIDDGSSDGSSKLCDEWALKDNRIRVFHQPNQGVSIARNEGIKKAKGYFLTFIDSDDWIGADYLKHLIIENKEVDLVVSGLVYVFSNHNSKKTNIKKRLYYNLSSEHCNEFITMLKENCFYGPVCKLYRTELIKSNNILFPENYSYGEDLMFNFNYLNYVRTIINIPDTDYYYRISDSGSLTTIYRKDRFENDYYQWKIVKTFCSERGLITNESNNYLGLKLWGIIYDSIFDKNNLSLLKLKKILSIDEIQYLHNTYNYFHAKNWIKKGIIKKKYFLFYALKLLHII